MGLTADGFGNEDGPGEPEPEIEVNITYRRNEILLQKEAPDRNWYIIVTDRTGGTRYDGYWRDSEDKTEAEALAEAKKGACI